MALSEALRARLRSRLSVSKSKSYKYKYAELTSTTITRTASASKGGASQMEVNRQSRKVKRSVKRPLAARLLSNRAMKKKIRCDSSSSTSTEFSAFDLNKKQLKRTRSSVASVFPRSTLQLREIIRNEQCLSEFLSFCQAHYSAENLLFWLNAERFRLLADEEQAKRLGVPLSKDLILRKAIELYNRFLKQDADEWVCLQTDTIEAITACLLKSPESVCCELFKKAQAETLLTVENDIIPRFIKYAVLSDKFEISQTLRDHLQTLLSQEVVCKT